MDCYRTCDIRGKYPEDVNEDLFFHFGRAIALKFLAGREILIGSDLRVSSPALKQALAAGLVEGGATVFDAGQAPTPVHYFGKRKLGAYAVAIVTASHNPPEDNGLKLALGRFPASATQLRALQPSPESLPSSQVRGRIEPVDLSSAYTDFLVDTWKDRLRSARSPGHLVLDPGNGAWALLIHEIIQRLDLPATVIHAQPDGSFPERSPDCAAPGNLVALGAEVQRMSASAGLAWDGDGDRLAVCDDAGRHLMTDHLVLLLLPSLLRNSHREQILFDAKMSTKIRVTIESLGGIPVEERSAHCYLETRMIKDDCLFGCEYSGHFFYRALSGGDDGMYAALSVIDFLARGGKPLTAHRESLPPLHISPDLRISGDGVDFEGVRDALRTAFKDANIKEFDGVRVEVPGAWFLVRPSVSENKVSFRFEGDSRDNLNSMMNHVLELLPQCRSPLARQIARWRASDPASI